MNFPTVTVKCTTAITVPFHNFNLCLSVMLNNLLCSFTPRGHHGRDHIVVGFTTTCAINVVSSNLAHGEVCSIQHCMIKFVSDF